MSFRCRIVHTSVFLRALQRMCISRDPWVTLIFRKDMVLMHAASDDQCATATATVPLDVFADVNLATPEGGPEYVRVMFDASNLISALTLNGGAGGAGGVSAAAGSFATTQIVMSYPSADGRFVVQLHDDQRVMQSTLLTRASKEHLLDLRFKNAASPNQAVLRADALRDAVAAIAAMQCDQISITFTAHEIHVKGLNSPFGEALMAFHCGADAVISHVCGDPNLTGKYLTSHVALAVGIGPAGGKATGRGGGAGGSRSNGGAGDNAPSNVLAGKVLLRVNAERQLCVTHQSFDHEPPVQVNVVTSALAQTLDDLM